jgi:hypothetical protein
LHGRKFGATHDLLARAWVVRSLRLFGRNTISSEKHRRSFYDYGSGRTVIEAKTVSVAQPPAPDNAMFTTAGLTAAGVGRTMAPASHVRFHVSSSDSTNLQVVVLHGTISTSGGMEQVEVLASSDTSKDQAALTRFGKSPFSFGTSPGATTRRVRYS